MPPTRIILLLFAWCSAAHAAPNAPIPIAELKRSDAVNFEREILPFLNDNCFSCHCQTTTKGGLNLETREQMLKGGDSGPAIVPQRGSESLLLQAAAHLDSDLIMPPRDNKAKAKNLTPEQLALLKLWVDQGAKPSPKVERKLAWQPMPATLGAIVAVAVTPDGQFAACTRANRICIYHLPSGRTVTEEVAHRDQVNALAFNADGTLLASGGYREVKLWRRIRETRKFTLADAGTPLAASPDGKWLATGCADGSVKLWQMPEGKLARQIATATGAVTALAFAADSERLAAVAADKSLTIWKVGDGSLLVTAETPCVTSAVTWLADGRHLVTGGADQMVRLWTDSLAPATELKGHTASVTALAVIQGPPARIVSGSADGSLRVWEPGKGRAVAVINHGAAITALVVRPDGQRIASGGANNAARLWDAAGKAICELKGDRYAQEFAGQCDRQLQIEAGTVAYRKEAVQTAETQLKATQERVKKSAEAIAPKQKDLEAKRKTAADARAEKTGTDQALASAGAALKTAIAAIEVAEKTAKEATTVLKTLNAATPPDQPAIEKASTDTAARAGEAAKARATRDRLAAEEKQASGKIEPAAKKLADVEDAAKKAQTARESAETELSLAKAEEQKLDGALRDAKAEVGLAEQTRKKAEQALQSARQAASGAEQPIRTLAFSPDNRMIAMGGEDGSIRTWSAETGAPFDVIKGHATAITGLAFVPDGTVIAAAADQSVTAWDVAPRWALERTIGSSDSKSPLADRVNALAFSPDGKVLATGSGEPSRGGEIKLWDAATGQLVRDVPNIHTDAVLALEFSPDGQRLASGAADKMARIIDLETGRIVRGLEGHTHHVLGVSWSPDGRTLATAGADSIVKIWDVTNGDRKKNIDGYDKEVTAVHFAGVTGSLLTSSGDNKVRLVGLDGKEIRTLPNVADFMESAAVTADGKLVVAGGQDSVLRVWNAADGKSVLTFPR